ncbi:HAMP domain-containing protein [Granulicatella sp. zg-ZJ]|uniref:ATP-binding protein n=1 Tax=unclassified Granulicatella TaxID=2630493 RepID=UPI0013C1A5CC|nr:MULTISPECIES: ATP-binding protein [unclassified Granulicatella]MBS4751073.1 HAMP domain-containing histidine kinase [Carnobacteriaceae bacterium zg-ZUI78]NEW62799.1 HAMP domain-containing protein [Granulicatella sp. zg-ZJ]NEW65423.1 HAMP domain-containing protein [Granulicatella sp. zg-84]QMI85219.1 HAMP domain-containing histidine kinase [Carnobacteriaceae bacterium zg-84]
MIKKLFSNNLSLRWKWAGMLSIIFSLLYLSISYVMVLFLKDQVFSSEINLITQYSQTMVRILSQSSEPLNEQNLHDFFTTSTRQTEFSTTAAIPYHFTNDNIEVRIFNTENRLIYESLPFPKIVFSPKNDELSVIKNNKKDVVITTHAIIDEKTQESKGYMQLIFGLNHYYQHVNNIYKTYGFITLIAIVICMIAGNIVAYIFFKPIKHMTDIMAELKEDALSDKRMDLSRRKSDELTDLSIGFNDLLDTMAMYITHQKRFVEDVSHELRTPVAIVEGHLQLLNRWGKDDPKVLEESLTASLSEIGRMKTLVQEMLDLSRAEQVGIHYKNEMTEVVGLVNQVHHNFELIHPKFKFQLENDYPKDETEIWVSISRHHLEQVLIILLDNAVKYSTDIPQIHLSLSKTLNNVQISVQDFGEGISEKDMKEVFARFYRVDKARSRHKGGNGLGLSIAKELIEGYKGSISVESVVGSGSTFRIELPVITDLSRIIQEKRKRKQKNIEQGEHYGL